MMNENEEILVDDIPKVEEVIQDDEINQPVQEDIYKEENGTPIEKEDSNKELKKKHQTCLQKKQKMQYQMRIHPKTEVIEPIPKTKYPKQVLDLKPM